jgi:hypothetical protein
MISPNCRAWRQPFIGDLTRNGGEMDHNASNICFTEAQPQQHLPDEFPAAEVPQGNRPEHFFRGCGRQVTAGQFEELEAVPRQGLRSGLA